jgi:hypothetical protein
LCTALHIYIFLIVNVATPVCLWLQVQEHHALTEQQFKILYRSKYLPLKEEHDRCSSEMARLRDSRAAALEANEKWRAQAYFCCPLLALSCKAYFGSQTSLQLHVC